MSPKDFKKLFKGTVSQDIRPAFFLANNALGFSGSQAKAVSIINYIRIRLQKLIPRHAAQRRVNF
jgi:hypothetical protein